MKISTLCAFICIAVVLDITLLSSQIAAVKLVERFSWKQMAFDWPSAEAEQAAIKSSRYIPKNNLPLGLERWKNKMFVTVPRWHAGVASSLNYIDLDSTEKSPKLRPYPSWEVSMLPIDEKTGAVAMQLKDNATVISTFRAQVDACDRLWVMDTGLEDVYGSSPNQITTSSIVIFDLKTDKLVRRYAIPLAQQNLEDTFFVNILVDSDSSECNNAYAYLPDLGAYSVVVYSFRDNHSYRVKHNFFHFEPLSGDFNVGGVNFQWTDGVFGMTLGPMQADHSRDVYFHAFAATKEFKVSNRVLQNESHVTSADNYYDFKLVGDRGMNGQSTAEVYDKETGVIFYTQVNKDAVACWNVKTPYNLESQGIVDSDSQTLVFPNDLKVDADGNLWALSDKMPQFLYKEMDPNVVNYRILVGKTSDLVKGTPCDALEKRLYFV